MEGNETTSNLRAYDLLSSRAPPILTTVLKQLIETETVERHATIPPHQQALRVNERQPSL